MAITESTTNNLKINFYKNETQFTSQTDLADNELHFIPATACVVETHHSGMTWYRIWSDGTIEQGGFKENSSASGESFTLTLPKAYSSTENYEIFLTLYHIERLQAPRLLSQTNSSFVMVGDDYSPYGSVFWRTIGK